MFELASCSWRIFSECPLQQSVQAPEVRWLRLSWTWCPFEKGFDLLQRLAFGFRDEDDGEDDVEAAHAGEEPERPGAGYEVLGGGGETD